MNNTPATVEQVAGRVEQLEAAVKWLSSTLCASTYNFFLSVLSGDDVVSYKQRFAEKAASLTKRVTTAPTVGEAIELAGGFCTELAQFASASKVNTADKAMEIAHSFIKKYAPVALPLKAIRQDDIWFVDIDVGALAVKVAKVKVDAKTGDILGYEIPQRETKV